jgi:hypothetical protein
LQPPFRTASRRIHNECFGKKFQFGQRACLFDHRHRSLRAEELPAGQSVSAVVEAVMRAAGWVIGALLWTVPVLAVASSSQDEQMVREDDQPRGDRWEDRWQGRQHFLYDEVWEDGTDGRAANAKADCRSLAIRYKRPDGTTAVRRENRCR